MSAETDIDAPSLVEAVAIADAYPDNFRFQNDWLIDIDGRIKQFTYDGQDLISKSCKKPAADKETYRAQTAGQRLTGQRIGDRSIVAVVPEVVPYGNSSDNSYLVSRYHGPDMNDDYYRGSSVALPQDDWANLLRLLAAKGICFEGMLPRNTITTPDSTLLIDWENANFHDRPTLPDRLMWTSFTIGWSYLYGSDVISDLRADMSDGNETDSKITGYEQAFSNFIGTMSDARQIRNLACNTAIAAEADRGHPLLAYKLDDAFHIIGEQLPTNIEVLMDMMLAVRDNAAHLVASRHVAAISRSLYEEISSGINTEQSVAKFKSRCARLAWLLVQTDSTKWAVNDGTELSTVDNSRPLCDVRELAESICLGITQAYPGACPNLSAAISTAQNIIDLSYLGAEELN